MSTDHSRRRGRRVAILVLVLVAAIGLIAWTHQRQSDPEPRLGEAPALRAPQGAGLSSVPESKDTELAPPGGDPEGADTFCRSEAGGTDTEGCRITASLKNPTIPAEPPPAASAEGGPQSIRLVRPDSLGRAAIPDAADPFVLVDGLTYFVFSTSAWLRNVPVVVIPASSLVPIGGGVPGFEIAGGLELDDPDGTIVRDEAMPEHPPWAVPDAEIWAPSVAHLGGRYVMYFAAKRPNPPEPVNSECVGRAFASHPQGPYVPEPTPFTCGLQATHGSLDPSVFQASNGAPFLLVASGGTSTPLWSIPLTGSGDAAGAPVPLLRMQQPWETWFLENPSMVPNGSDFVLAYSAGDWRSPSYSTGIANCSSPIGPCRSSQSGPWLSTTGGVSGPGGLSFFTDVNGKLMAAYHGYGTGAEALHGARSTFIRRVDLTADSIALM